jgi:hypothetical protein
MPLRKLAVTVCGLLTIALLLPPVAARADQFTGQTTLSVKMPIDINNQTLPVNFNLGGFHLFDPSLGTLTSVEFAFTLEPITSWVANPSNADLRFFINMGPQFSPVFDLIFDLAPGLYTSSITETKSTQSIPKLDIQNFIGTGKETIGLNLSPSGPFGSSGTFSTAFMVSDLTYTFTPAAQVPGPIAGAGLPGLILACRVLLILARRRRQIA